MAEQFWPEITDAEVELALATLPTHFVFVPGYSQGVTFKPTGQSNFTTLNITDWTYTDTGEKLDVSHTGTVGVQALLAGLQRGDGNVKANFDTAQIPSTSPTPHLIFGTKGVITFAVGTSNPFQIGVMVTKVHYVSSVAGKVEYDFDVSLDFITQSGVTYPT